MSDPRADRIGAVLSGVLAQALRDSGRAAIMIQDAGTPEGELLASLCARYGVPAEPAPEPSLALVAALGDDVLAARVTAEVEGGRRSLLLAHPANRTALLLAEPPPAPLLPLGDVPASLVDSMSGAWTAPPSVRELAEAAGGVAALDACLFRWLERRESFEVAAASLPAAVARELRCRIDRGRFFRRRAGLVPKLGHRTIGHDLQI